MSKTFRHVIIAYLFLINVTILSGFNSVASAKDDSKAIEQSVHSVFLKLLERDGHLQEFSQAGSKLAVICMDWNTVKQARDTQLLQIEHYWTRYDEPMNEMRKAALEKCTSWRQGKSCECVVLLENDVLVAQAPDAVRERINRAAKAWALIRAEATQDKYRRARVSLGAKQYLSETPSSPYAILQKIQKTSCEKLGNAAHPGCSFDREACLKRLRQLSVLLGDIDSEVIGISCDQVSTKYEMPGVYDFLYHFFVELSLAADLEGIALQDQFAFGSLPTNKINVSIAPKEIQGARLIFFNIKFFSFVYEMAKMASLSIPFGAESSETISIDASPEGLSAYLEKNPQVERAFLETVLTFLDLADRPPISPPKNIQPILAVFGFGAEEFAMAHEMAHAILKHSREAVLNLEAEECGKESGEPWIEEIEADYLGFRLLAGVADIRAACSGAIIDNNNGLSLVGEPVGYCEANPFGVGIPLAAVSYFTAQEIKEDACSIIKSGSVSRPDPLELELLAFSKRCQANNECDFLRDVRKNLPGALLIKKGHPHPSIRKEFAKLWILNPDLMSGDNPVSSIGISLSRNSEVIWQRSRTKVVQLKEGLK